MSYFFCLPILFHLYQNGEKCVCELKRQEAVWNLYSINKEHFMFPLLKTVFKNQAKALTDAEIEGFFNLLYSII